LRLVESLGIEKSIMRPGFVKNEDMTAIYSAASCVVLPSWYEGFGFPVLEAMACGVPVVASNKGSVPEILGPAKSVDPSDPASIAKGIFDTVQLPTTDRKKIIKKGFEWVKQFSWRRVARETAAVYEKVVTEK